MHDRPQCEASRKDGTRCRAAALPGEPRCWAHSERTRQARQQARRKGGRSRMRPAAVLPPESPDASLATVADVLALLGETVNQVRRGELDAKVANCVGYLASVGLRAMVDVDLAARVAALEKHLNLRGGNQPCSRIA